MYHNRVAGNRPGFARQLQLQITLPVDGEEAGAALEPDDALPEVVPADLEPQPQHRGKGVVVLLADLLRPQVVVPGLAKVDQL